MVGGTGVEPDSCRVCARTVALPAPYAATEPAAGLEPANPDRYKDWSGAITTLPRRDNRRAHARRPEGEDILRWTIRFGM